MDDYTKPAEVERIAALSEPVIRNLQITQSYGELSTAIARRTGPCANWCTFATWASKQAGQTIRREDMLRALEDTLADIPEAGLLAGHLLARASEAVQAKPDSVSRKVWDLLDVEGGMARASDAVARGNQKVYAEIGRVFSDFIETCLNDPAPDEQKIQGFVAALRPGDPPDGQEYLRRAFTHLYQALFSENTKARAELILLANIEVGFHEQTRLQPEIREALDSSLPDPGVYTRRMAGALFPARGWLYYGYWLLRRWLGSPSPVDVAITNFYEAARLRIRRFLTKHFMTIGLPNARLRLGKDLNAAFPDSLFELTNPELRALLTRVDATADSLLDTATIDWADLPDRLHYIVDLFRCYQETAALLQPPFGQEQVAVLKAGRLPAGLL